MIKILLKIMGTILALLLVGSLILYLVFNQALPEGPQSAEADALANKMLSAVHHDAFQETRFIEWSFAGRHHYRWDKQNHEVDVRWDGNKVILNTKAPDSSRVFINDALINDADVKTKLIDKARDYFNNDSFWLVAPHKVFDPGTERRLITLENGEKGLLVTYTSGGSTPGDSYLWILDETGLPKAFRMWVSIIPIGGLKASWEHWKDTEADVVLPQKHKLLFLEFEMENVRAWNG